MNLEPVIATRSSKKCDSIFWFIVQSFLHLISSVNLVFIEARADYSKDPNNRTCTPIYVADKVQLPYTYKSPTRGKIGEKVQKLKNKQTTLHVYLGLDVYSGP